MGKKCSKCGNELKANAKFCPECGAVVEEEVKEVKTESKKEPTQKNGKKVAAIAVAAIAIVGIGGLGYAKIANHKSEEPVKKEAATDTKKEETPKKETMKAEEPKTYHYQWLVNPTIEADQLYYVTKSDAGAPFNEYHKQFDSAYTIIEKDGLKGWIDSTGVLYTDIKYDNISYVMYNNDETCIMKTPDKKYQTYNEYESIELVDSDTSYDVIDGYDLDGYADEDEDISDQSIISKETEELTNNLCWNAGYYYDGEVRYAHTTEYGENTGHLVLEGTMPMRESDKIITTLAEWQKLDGKYAIVSNGEPVTDFIYDECGSESEDLFAVCKDGKWGYVDETGKEVIPLEYDTSWNRYSANEAEATNVEASPATDDYCYAAAYGYVNLRKGDQWKLCDVTGKEIIPFGEFEEILPVMSDQCCWVKKDGKWGVIKVLEEEVSSTEYDDWKDEYIDWINSKSDSDYTYEMIELDNNVVPEIVAISSDPSEESMILSCGNSSENAEYIEIDRKGTRYIPGENIVDINSGNMDDYSDDFYKLQNGYWTLVITGSYSNAEDSDLQLDADGNPIYTYTWNSEEVSKEQYEQNKEKLIPSNKAVAVKEKGMSGAEMIKEIENYKK